MFWRTARTHTKLQWRSVLCPKHNEEVSGLLCFLVFLMTLIMVAVEDLCFSWVFCKYMYCIVIIQTSFAGFVGCIQIGCILSVVRAPDLWLKGCGFESPQERGENFLLQGQLSVLTLISVFVPPPCYRSSTSFGKNAGGRLQLNTHAPYVIWCMVVWCTQNAPRWQLFRVAPAM